MNEQNKNKRGRPQKYLFAKDFEHWLLKEWFPFKMNDWPHLQNDVAWLKRIMVGILIALIAAAIAVLTRGG